MYETYFKIKTMPFVRLFDPDFYFLSQSHERAYTHLVDAVTETKDYMVITGDPGAGKTTLINYFLSETHPNIKLGYIADLHAPVDNLTEQICCEFSLDVKGKSSIGMLDFFHGFLLKQYEIEQRVVLIVDDAHNLTPEALEELNVISNLETEEPDLIQIILVGRPELNYLLRQTSLKLLCNRLLVRCHLDGLSQAETGQYIRHRLTVAGAENLDLFADDSVSAIHTHSKGIPLIVNTLCDVALANGFAEKTQPINSAIIEDIVQDQPETHASASVPVEEELSQKEPQVEQAPDKAVEEQLPLEDRVGKLMGLGREIDKKLDTLLKRKDSRDITIVELNKMLMESLKRHGNTIKQFREYKEKAKQPKKLYARSRKEIVSHDGVI